MRTRTLVLAVVLASTVLMGAAAVGYLALQRLDLETYRTRTVAAVEQATGRACSLGELQLGWRRGLVIRAYDLTLANAPWGSRPRMLAVGRVEARVAFWPLLAGEVRIDRIGLESLDLLLETGPAGEGNWDFAGAPAPGNAPLIKLDALLIEDSRLTWQPPQAPALLLHIGHLAMQPDSGGASLVLLGQGSLGGQEVRLDGRFGGSWSAARPVDFDLRLQALGAHLEATGSLQPAAWGLDIRSSVRILGLDLARLGSIGGQTWPSLAPLDLAFELSRDAETWQIANASARSGSSDLTADLVFSATGIRPRLAGSVRAQHVNLAEWPPGPVPRAHPPGRVFSQAPLELGLLRQLDLELQVDLAQLSGDRTELRDVQLIARIASGRLNLKVLGAVMPAGGRIDGSLALDSTPAQPQWTLALRLTQVPVQALLSARAAPLVDAPADLRLALRSRGQAPAEIAAHLGGEVRLLLGKGRARLQDVDALVGGLSTLSGQLLSNAGGDALLNCALAQFSVQEGTLKTEALLIDSAVSTLRGDGTIDLGAEQFDLTFEPRPKTATLTLAVPVHVRGSLRNPRFEPDQLGSAKKLVGVVGLFVYPPAAVAALGDLGSSDNACVRILHGGAAGEPPGGTLDQAQEGAESTTRKLGSGLRKLLGD